MQKFIIVIFTLFIYSSSIAQSNFGDLNSFPDHGFYPNKKEIIITNKIHTIISVKQHYYNDTLNIVDTIIMNYDDSGNILNHKTINTNNKLTGKARRMIFVDSYTYDYENRTSESKDYIQGKDSMMIIISGKTTFDDNWNVLHSTGKMLEQKIDFSRYDTSQHKKILIFDTVSHKVVWEYNNINKGEGLPAIDSNKIGYFLRYTEGKNVYDKKNRLIETYSKRDSEEYKLDNIFEYGRKGRLISHTWGSQVSTFEYKKDKIIVYKSINNKEPEIYTIALLNSQKQVTQILKPEKFNKLNKDFYTEEEYSYNSDGTIHCKTSYYNFPDMTKTKIVHSKTVETFTYL